MQIGSAATMFALIWVFNSSASISGWRQSCVLMDATTNGMQVKETRTRRRTLEVLCGSDEDVYTIANRTRICTRPMGRRNWRSGWHWLQIVEQRLRGSWKQMLAAIEIESGSRAAVKEWPSGGNGEEARAPEATVLCCLIDGRCGLGLSPVAPSRQLLSQSQLHSKRPLSPTEAGRVKTLGYIRFHLVEDTKGFWRCQCIFEPARRKHVQMDTVSKRHPLRLAVADTLAADVAQGRFLSCRLAPVESSSSWTRYLASNHETSWHRSI